jgi:hypothetical protein
MYTIKELHSDTITDWEIQNIIEFCDEFGPDANYQYRHNQFEQEPNHWYSLMFKEGRFLKAVGGLCVAYDGDTIVAISGYSRSTIDPNIFIIGIRTLKNPEYRDFSTIMKGLIPYQRQSIRAKGGKCMISLFDIDKGQSFYKLARRQAVKKFVENGRTEYHPGWLALDYPIQINNSVLNVVCEYLDPAFEFDWKKLRAVGP